MKNKTYIALGICAGLLVVNTGFLLQISNRQKVLERQMENMQNQVMDSISVNTLSLIHILSAQPHTDYYKHHPNPQASIQYPRLPPRLSPLLRRQDNIPQWRPYSWHQ